MSHKYIDFISCRYLLENGADPNIQDKSGKTALMHACLEQAGPEILSLLLGCGADPTLDDHSGLSALVYAVNSGNRDILQVLVDACKAKGKEVIIITTDKLPSGQQTTKQYLNVPPPPDLVERMHYTPMHWPFENQLRMPPQGTSASTSPQPGGPVLRDPTNSRPSSPIQNPSTIPVPSIDKPRNLQRYHSELGLKSSPVLQHSHSCNLTEEMLETSGEGKDFSFKSLQGRRSIFSRHHSIDVKDKSGLLKALESMSASESRGKKLFGRKMSYDGVTNSPHSASHPNLHQDNPQFSEVSKPDNENSSDYVSTLRNVVRRRNIGFEHYNSDSQLPQFGSQNANSKNNTGMGQERRKLVNSKSSTLSGSRESLESLKRSMFERRGSGALLLDHIAHTRPGFLPPLNPHAPIPDIGVSSCSTYPFSGSSKTLNSSLTGSKPILPCAPIFPKDLLSKKMLWRRHSMQSEQITQLANFEETFGR